MKLEAMSKAARKIFWTLLLGVVALGLSRPDIALAQTSRSKDLPVLEAKTDVNGVDMTSGSYVTIAPFDLKAPGAGHLDMRTLFNGRQLSSTVNIYLEDLTYTPYYMDPAERHIRVHVGGRDKLFKCFDGGSCTQSFSVDGATLVRSANKYVLTDGDGAIYSFFDLAIEQLQSCTEEGCNAAGYHAVTYVSTILYPSGEKLSYEPYTVKQAVGGGYRAIDTIRSNLGYRLTLSRDVAPDFTPQTTPGFNWLHYRPGNQGGMVFTLYNNQTVVGSLSSAIAYSNGYQDAVVTQRDDLQRVYQINLHAAVVFTCSGGHDYTYLVPTTVISPGGVRTDITYKASSLFDREVPVTSVIRGGRTWRYSFPRASGTSSVTTPLQGVQSFTLMGIYDGYDHGENACDNVGLVRTNIVSSQDELTRRKDYAYGIDNVSKPTQALLPEDDGYSYGYDARGNLTTITRLPKPNSGLTASVVYKADYDATCVYPVKCNKPNWTQDAKGFLANYRTDYIYDTTHGGVLSMMSPPATPNGVRPQTRYTYSSHDTGDGTLYRLEKISTCATNASCTDTADESKITYTYWNNTLLPATVTGSAGAGGVPATTSYTYDLAGRPVAVTNPRGKTVVTLYDAVGQVVGAISPDLGDSALPRQARRMTYNADGQVTKLEEGTVAGATKADLDAMAVTRTVEARYDSVGRKTFDIGVADGATFEITQYSYDDNDRLECTAVRMSLTAALPPSACEQTANVTIPDRITRNVYDAAGQIVQVRSGVGTPIERAEATYSFTDNGKAEYLVDANGNRSRRTYDGFDRPAGFYLPAKALVTGFNPSTQVTALATAGASSTADYEAYEYDANDNRTSLRKRDARTLTYEYDALDRMTRKVVPDACVAGYACTPAPASATRDVYYGYDLRGLLLYARFDSATGQGVTNVYDAFARLKTTTVDLGGNTRQVGYEYDGNGNRTKITHADGQVFNYVYDALDRSKTIRRNEDPDLQTITYNPQGLRKKSFGEAATYGYDAPGRLHTLTYNLSGDGYDVTTTLDYNPAKQVTQAAISNDLYSYRERGPGSRVYTINGLNQYTAAGTSTMTYDANGSLMSSGTTGYVYDVENRLVGVTGNGVAELSYDPTGRLFQTSVGGGSVTQFLYDGSALIAEYNGANGLTRRYVHGVGDDVPTASYEGASIDAANRRNLFADRQGSIVAMTTSDFAVTQVNNYDEYGIPAAGNFGRFQYTGQTWLPEVGLYYYKARFYSPTLGRFLQTDPIGYEDGLNWYAYTSNDPVNRSDPSGTQVAPLSSYTSSDEHYTAVMAGYGAMGNALIEQFKKDPIGTTVDGVAIIFDVATVPSGEAAAFITARRAAREGAEEAAGIIYKRTNQKTGRCYIGRCNSEQLFERRQRDHGRKNPDAEYTYEVVDRKKPGKELREAEQQKITENGGPTNKSNPDGGTENKRNEIRQCTADKKGC